MMRQLHQRLVMGRFRRTREPSAALVRHPIADLPNPHLIVANLTDNGSMMLAKTARSARRSLLAALLALTALGAVGAGTASAQSYVIGMQDTAQTLSFGTQTQALDEMQALGVHVVRITMSWSDVAAGCSASLTLAELADPDNACYSWSLYDALVANAQSRGIQVLASVWKTPNWANGQADKPYNIGRNWSQFKVVVARYKSFITAAGTRYRAGSGHGVIKYWTIWNEPNSRRFWSPWTGAKDSAKRYAYMYSVGAAALKKVNKSAKVAPGPTGPNSTGSKPVTYIKNMQPWLKKYHARIDAWAHNTYAGAPVAPNRPAFHSPSVGLGNISDLFNALDAAKITRHKQVWSAEFAYETPPDRHFSTSFQNQALWMGNAMDIAWRTHRVSMFIWYVMVDATAKDDWQSGVISASGKKKISYYMYQRPVSLSSTKIHKGDTVSVWGVSNLHPGAGKLVWSTSNKFTKVHTLRNRRGANGVRTASFRPPAKGTYFVAVRDGSGIGSSVRLIVR